MKNKTVFISDMFWQQLAENNVGKGTAISSFPAMFQKLLLLRVITKGTVSLNAPISNQRKIPFYKGLRYSTLIYMYIVGVYLEQKKKKSLRQG